MKLSLFSLVRRAEACRPSRRRRALKKTQYLAARPTVMRYKARRSHRRRDDKRKEARKHRVPARARDPPPSPHRARVGEGTDRVWSVSAALLRSFVPQDGKASFIGRASRKAFLPRRLLELYGSFRGGDIGEEDDEDLVGPSTRTPFVTDNPDWSSALTDFAGSRGYVHLLDILQTGSAVG